MSTKVSPTMYLFHITVNIDPEDPRHDPSFKLSLETLPNTRRREFGPPVFVRVVWSGSD